MVPVIFIANFITKGNWLESLMFGITIAVGLMPEMLPVNLRLFCLFIKSHPEKGFNPAQYAQLRRIFLSDSRKAVFEVCDDVVNMLCSYGKTYRVLMDSCGF